MRAALSSRIGGTLLLTVVLVSVIVASLPRLVGRTASAYGMRSKPWSERKRIVNGPIETSALHLNSQIDAKKDLTILAAAPGDIGDAAFLNAHFFPQSTWLFVGQRELTRAMVAYRTMPEQLLVVDGRSGVGPQLMRYPRLVSSQLSSAHRSLLESHRDEERTIAGRSLLPFVASIRGADRYTTALHMINEGPTKASAAIFFAGSYGGAWKRMNISLLPGEELWSDDFLTDYLADEGLGTIFVRTRKPLRIGVWLLNHKLQTLVATPPVEGNCTKGSRVIPSFVVLDSSNATLWVLSRSDELQRVTVSIRDDVGTVTREVTPAPGELLQLGDPSIWTNRRCAPCKLEVNATPPAGECAPELFLSHWNARGETLFEWGALR